MYLQEHVTKAKTNTCFPHVLPLAKKNEFRSPSHTDDLGRDFSNASRADYTGLPSYAVWP